MINKGWTDNKNCLKDNSTNNMRICIHHFYPSTIDISKNSKIALKIGACFITHLTYQALASDRLKENKSLLRFNLNVEKELQLEVIKWKLLSQKEKIKENIVNYCICNND